MNVERVIAMVLLHWKSVKDEVPMMQTNLTPDIDHIHPRSPQICSLSSLLYSSILFSPTFMQKDNLLHSSSKHLPTVHCFWLLMAALDLSRTTAPFWRHLLRLHLKFRPTPLTLHNVFEKIQISLISHEIHFTCFQGNMDLFTNIATAEILQWPLVSWSHWLA